MKISKFLSVVICVFTFIAFFNINVNAEEIVNITSGITDEYEVTFDTYKIISGEAKEGTKVVLKQYVQTNDEEYDLKKVAIYNIGLTEFFTDTFKLDVGMNKMSLEASYKDQTVTNEYLISKKDEKIKEELKSGVMPFMPNFNLIFKANMLNK